MSSIADMFPVGGGDLDTRYGHRRASRRYPLHADVEILSPRVTVGVTLNASAGGLRIATSEGLQVGDLCSLRIRTAKFDQIEHGRVAWVRELPDGFVMGIAFIQPN